MRYDGDNIYYACPVCAMPFNNTSISLGASYLVNSDSDSILSPSAFNSSHGSAETTQSYVLPSINPIPKISKLLT